MVRQRWSDLRIGCTILAIFAVLLALSFLLAGERLPRQLRPGPRPVVPVQPEAAPLPLPLPQ